MKFSKAHFLNELIQLNQTINESLNQGKLTEAHDSVNEAEKYITNNFKVGDKIKTNIGEWEIIETDYKPGKSFSAPFIFKGKDMKKLNIPNPPKTNKNAVGYKVTDGDKYPIIGFLYQYKDITKLATVGVDESVNEASISLSPEDMDKLHGTGKITKDGITITYKEPKHQEPQDENENSFKDFKSYGKLNETVGTVSAPVYGEAPEEFPEIAVEGDEESKKRYTTELVKILKELYDTALSCGCDGNTMKDTLKPRYKHSKVKMNVTEDGDFRFDSFGRYPNIAINLKNMKEGNHTKDTIKEEIKKNIKKLNERMPGMPSQSAISSFSSDPHLPA